MIVCVISIASIKANAQVTRSVDVGAPWLGWMNVFELPENGGAYLWGSGWGTEDLVATFSAEPVLTLAPNTIDDPNEYWYQDTCNCAADPANPGGPGQAGNKIMEANMYVEDDTLVGETLTFSGTVLSNSLTFDYETIAFIKDFTPDYSSFTQEIFYLDGPGPFSITLPTLPDPGRHVQYGFQMIGPNVWVTDVAPFGDVQIEAVGSVPTGDFDNDGDVDGIDFLQWQLGASDNPLSAEDLATWAGNFGTTTPLATTLSVVPEPSSALLALFSLVCLGSAIRQRH